MGVSFRVAFFSYFTIIFTVGGKERMKVNGTQIPMEKSMTLEDFLLREGYVLTRVAVELNGEIIPKSKYNQTFLTHEDVMEVVNFVGGG